MTAMKGGEADKLGNRYEHLWTALRFADLLDGTASRIRLEPPSIDGTGIEFEIDTEGATWGEQAKDSSQNWTINRLNTEKILAAAKLQDGLGRNFRFVASAHALSFQTLAERSRATKDLAEFEAVLTKELTPEFDALTGFWNLSSAESWQLLQRIYVEQYSLAGLERLAVAAYQRLYSGDPNLILGEIRNFCDRHMHQDLTAPQLANHLVEKGFQRRLLAGDTNVGNRLHLTVQRQHRRAEIAEPRFGLVPRPESATLRALLTSPSSPQITILDGAAGTGKSAVIAGLASSLESEGWFVAVARMDHGILTRTSDQLGIQMGLSESPSVLISGVADKSPGILIIDQLDAVSIFSGRAPDSFDAVIDVLEEISRARNLKLLLVLRTIDLERDPRMAGLLRGKHAVGRITLAKLPLELVREYLQANYASMPSPNTVELLRTPLHLAVYDRLSDEARQQSYRTRQELYQELTEEVRRRAAIRLGSLDWNGITSTMINFMSSNESLEAPISILDQFAPEAVSVLASEEILIRDDTSIAFFHESYFDYLFARGFVNSGGNLHKFLADSGQHLFRRGQTRQILEHLVATDRPEFRRVVAELLAAGDVRSHLKEVVIEVLRQIEPVAADWEALENLAWCDNAVALKIRTLLSGPSWFDAADELGRWEAWLGNDDRADLVIQQLIFAARQRASRVAELVRPHIGSTESWRNRFSALVAWSLTPELVDLAVELISAGEIDDARGPIAVNSDFWSIIYGLDEHPEAAARMIGAYLTRALFRSQAAGSMDPFRSEHISLDSQSATIIREVAARAPMQFVTEVLPFVIAVATANQQSFKNRLPTGGRWGVRYRDTAFKVDDLIFAATETALRLLAEQGSISDSHLQMLGDAESSELRFLACRTRAAGGDADEAVEWLLGDPRNLVLGWADSPNWASRELILAHSAACSGDLFARLEEKLLTDPYLASVDREYEQYTLLSALDNERSSPDARRRLGELSRRFSEQAPTPPEPITAQWVGSPIGADATKRMSDENWLSALRRHRHDGADWRGRVPVGGATQLAQLLGQRANEDPDRFSRLALRFGPEIPSVAMGHIIRNIAAAVDVDALTQVCELAASLYGEQVGHDICIAIASAKVVNARLVSLVEKYSRAEDPDQDVAIASGEGAALYGGDLFNAGLNSTRGAAAVAATNILNIGVEFAEALLPTITQLASDPVVAVRTRAAEAIVALKQHRPEIALTLASRLFDSRVEVFDAPSTEELLTDVLLGDPDRFAETLQRMLDGPPQIAKRGGRIWAIAGHHGALRPPLPPDVTPPDDIGDRWLCRRVWAIRRPRQRRRFSLGWPRSRRSLLSAGARTGAAEVLSANVSESTELLAVLFNDPEPEVRQAAARSMRRLPETGTPDVDELIEKFIGSAAFVDHMEDLIDGLAVARSRLPPATLTACQRAVAVAAANLGDVRTGHAAMGQNLIRILLRLYRQSDAPTRAQCLDVIDTMIDLNAYGIAQALQDER